MNNPFLPLFSLESRLRDLRSRARAYGINYDDDNGASQVRVLLQKTRDPKRRAHLNDLWQQLRSSGENHPVSPSACWRQRPRPRVTKLPAQWSSESEKARARRLKHERSAP